MDLDEIDRRLLAEIQTEGRLSNAELARRLNLSAPGAHARLKKLEEAGVIKQYVALLDRDQLGFDLLCFVFIRMQVHEIKSLDSFQHHINSYDEVLECHNVTGEFDFILKVVVKNRAGLQNFVQNKLIPLHGIAQITTSVLLNTVKESPVLPIR